MAFFFEIHNQLQIKETAVDCNRCHINLKCCTYRPFFSNFLLGYAESLNLLPEDWHCEWDLLVVGASPNVQYRKNFKKIGSWGFGTETQLLCTFFSSQSRSCKVWSARPGVCRAFYCKSSFSEEGSAYWKKFEDFVWHLEWCLLEDFLFTKGFTLDDVALLKRYLDDTVKVKVGLPALNDLRFVSWQEARQFYIESWNYVQQADREHIQDIVGEFGRKMWSELLAEKAKFK